MTLNKEMVVLAFFISSIVVAKDGGALNLINGSDSIYYLQDYEIKMENNSRVNSTRTSTSIKVVISGEKNVIVGEESKFSIYILPEDYNDVYMADQIYQSYSAVDRYRYPHIRISEIYDASWSENPSLLILTPKDEVNILENINHYSFFPKPDIDPSKRWQDFGLRNSGVHEVNSMIEITGLAVNPIKSLAEKLILKLLGETALHLQKQNTPISKMDLKKNTITQISITGNESMFEDPTYWVLSNIQHSEASARAVSIPLVFKNVGSVNIEIKIFAKVELYKEYEPFSHRIGQADFDGHAIFTISVLEDEQDKKLRATQNSDISITPKVSVLAGKIGGHLMVENFDTFIFVIDQKDNSVFGYTKVLGIDSPNCGYWSIPNLPTGVRAKLVMINEGGKAAYESQDMLINKRYKLVNVEFEKKSNMDGKLDKLSNDLRRIIKYDKRMVAYSTPEIEIQEDWSIEKSKSNGKKVPIYSGTVGVDYPEKIVGHMVVDSPKANEPILPHINITPFRQQLLLQNPQMNRYLPMYEGDNIIGYIDMVPFYREGDKLMLEIKKAEELFRRY
jgi:hypothetical protein